MLLVRWLAPGEPRTLARALAELIALRRSSPWPPPGIWSGACCARRWDRYGAAGWRRRAPEPGPAACGSSASATATRPGRPAAMRRPGPPRSQWLRGTGHSVRVLTTLPDPTDSAVAAHAAPGGRPPRAALVLAGAPLPQPQPVRVPGDRARQRRRARPPPAGVLARRGDVVGDGRNVAVAAGTGAARGTTSGGGGRRRVAGLRPRGRRLDPALARLAPVAGAPAPSARPGSRPGWRSSGRRCGRSTPPTPARWPARRGWTWSMPPSTIPASTLERFQGRRTVAGEGVGLAAALLRADRPAQGNRHRHPRADPAAPRGATDRSRHRRPRSPGPAHGAGPSARRSPTRSTFSSGPPEQVPASTPPAMPLVFPVTWREPWGLVPAGGDGVPAAGGGQPRRGRHRRVPRGRRATACSSSPRTPRGWRRRVTRLAERPRAARVAGSLRSRHRRALHRAAVSRRHRPAAVRDGGPGAAAVSRATAVSVRPSVSVIVAVRRLRAQQLAGLRRRLAALELGPRDELLVADNRPRRRRRARGRVGRRGADPRPPAAGVPGVCPQPRGAGGRAGSGWCSSTPTPAPAAGCCERYFDPPPGDGTGVLAGGILDRPGGDGVAAAPAPGADR